VRNDLYQEPIKAREILRDHFTTNRLIIECFLCFLPLEKVFPVDDAKSDKELQDNPHVLLPVIGESSLHACLDKEHDELVLERLDFLRLCRRLQHLERLDGQ
jgi:hypothetical protein